MNRYQGFEAHTSSKATRAAADPGRHADVLLEELLPGHANTGASQAPRWGPLNSTFEAAPYTHASEADHGHAAPQQHQPQGSKRRSPKRTRVLSSGGRHILEAAAPSPTKPSHRPSASAPYITSPPSPTPPANSIWQLPYQDTLAPNTHNPGSTAHGTQLNSEQGGTTTRRTRSHTRAHSHAAPSQPQPLAPAHTHPPSSVWPRSPSARAACQAAAAARTQPCTDGVDASTTAWGADGGNTAFPQSVSGGKDRGHVSGRVLRNGKGGIDSGASVLDAPHLAATADWGGATAGEAATAGAGLPVSHGGFGEGLSGDSNAASGGGGAGSARGSEGGDSGDGFLSKGTGEKKSTRVGAGLRSSSVAVGAVLVAAQQHVAESSYDGAAAVLHLERALLWEEPWLSVRYLGGGLYAIIATKQAITASQYLHPTTLMLAAFFMILIANLTAGAVRALRSSAWAQRAHRAGTPHFLARHMPQPQHQEGGSSQLHASEQPHVTGQAPTAGQPPQTPRALNARSVRERQRRRQHGGDKDVRSQGVAAQAHACEGLGSLDELRGGMGPGGEACANGVAHVGNAQGQGLSEGAREGEGPSESMMQHALAQERVVFQWAHLLLSAICNWGVPVVAACCALSYRALSGRRLATSVLVAGTLWLGMLLSELSLLSPTTFCALLYITIFTLPAIYIRSRQAMDGAVETLLRFLTRLLVSCLEKDRASLLLTTSTLFLVYVCTPFSLVARASLALAAAFCVLVYNTMVRQRHKSTGAASTVQVIEES